MPCAACAMLWADLRILSAVLNASMTDLPLEGITSELMEKVMHSSGAAAPLVPVLGTRFT